MYTQCIFFFFLMIRRPPRSTLFPYTRSSDLRTTQLSQELAGASRSPATILLIAPFDLILQRRILQLQKVFHVVDRKSTRLNSSHSQISYAVFCLKKKKTHHCTHPHYYAPYST